MVLDARADTRSEAARRALDEAFALADEAAGASGDPLIGVLGHGLPETLVAASGALPVHLNFGREPADSPMDGVIEPFVDVEVRIFLNRFASGAFDGMRGIVFARDDAAALTAYQYATEWVRQGRASSGAPPLFLFNLVHASSMPVAAFNAIQLGKLQAFLAGVGCPAPSKAALAQAASVAARRRAILAGLVAIADAATAARWRNAGRFLSAQRHCDLVDAALAGVSISAPATRRLALVGSPVADAPFFEMLGNFGEVACDLQGFGHVWPGSWETEAIPERMLASLAADGLCPRISPPLAHRRALVETIAAGQCDLVVCQLAHTDDTFGWEVPGLRDELADMGIRFVNLGFRDRNPDAGWLQQAARSISAALERAP